MRSDLCIMHRSHPLSPPFSLFACAASRGGSPAAAADKLGSYTPILGRQASRLMDHRPARPFGGGFGVATVPLRPFGVPLSGAGGRWTAFTIFPDLQRCKRMKRSFALAFLAPLPRIVPLRLRSGTRACAGPQGLWILDRMSSAHRGKRWRSRLRARRRSATTSKAAAAAEQELVDPKAQIAKLEAERSMPGRPRAR
ncbi:hypothetical protein DFJ74DRAFT_514776 [Hyaloraphidium curvatum]|nr:hypothetical protein DFJ74DRAFT_514776 [Hyaloraphidium curvatum]